MAGALAEARVRLTIAELASDGRHLAGVLELEKAADALRAFPAR